MSLDDDNLSGFDGLMKALDKLKDETSSKILRQSAVASVNPVIQRMRARAPKGSRAHRTYKGRLVAPGFLSRSIRKRSRIDRRSGRVVVTVGVANEAFYGLFYDRGFTRKRGGKVAGNSWFVDSFIDMKDETENQLASNIRRRITKVRAR